jgi:hypothetical protein
MRGGGEEKAAMRPVMGYGWHPIESAPLDEDLTLQVTDGSGATYVIRWPCRRTATGWINARKGTQLAVTPVLWRLYREPPSRIRGVVTGDR